ncbi:hypothetical protein BGZ63DRAFT_232814 [Mariannaea sp. PMI_226]|nr:hypothetical protein BGZ63DRAFT_232814 [Mariannaea sp. PMI_226]
MTEIGKGREQQTASDNGLGFWSVSGTGYSHRHFANRHYYVSLINTGRHTVYVCIAFRFFTNHKFSFKHIPKKSGRCVQSSQLIIAETNTGRGPTAPRWRASSQNCGRVQLVTVRTVSCRRVSVFFFPSPSLEETAFSYLGQKIKHQRRDK